MINIYSVIGSAKIKHNFTLSKFPDGTSQAWQIENFKKLSNCLSVDWVFENESELVTICQLGDLLNTTNPLMLQLNVNFLPYGRQDKEVSNNTTFARSTFEKMVKACGYKYIVTFDAHSISDMTVSGVPEKFHKAVIPVNAIICFPDSGAMGRYEHLSEFYTIYCNKTRNQQTGEITGLEVKNAAPGIIAGSDVYIVDDIADGGGTFIKVAEALKQYLPANINLVVSHGLFTKGVEVLYNSGIDNIYTTNTLLRNKPGNGYWYSPELLNQEKKYGFNVYKEVDIEYNKPSGE